MVALPQQNKRIVMSFQTVDNFIRYGIKLLSIVWEDVKTLKGFLF